MSSYPEIEGHYLPMLDQTIRYIRHIESISMNEEIKQDLNKVCDFLLNLYQLLMCISSE